MIRAAALILLALGTPALAAPPARGPAAEPGLSALLKRCFDAYGGLERLERQAARLEEGRVQLSKDNPLHPGATGRLARAWERPARLRVEIGYQGSEPEVRVLDGGRGWRNGSEVTGTAPYLAMVLQAARLDLPYLLASRRLQLEDRGTVKRAGKALRAVAVPLGNGVTLTAEIEPATGRILRSSSSMPLGGGATEFVALYSDFRTVEGLLVPFHEENWASGVRTGETTLERVQPLRVAPAGAFRP